MGTNHVGRVYALALALVVFFLAWAVVAARPWGTATADARLKTLAVREAQLRREAQLVNRVVARRWATYRVELHTRQAAIAAARTASAQAATSYSPAATGGSVRIVTLPPLTITRTS